MSVKIIACSTADLPQHFEKKIIKVPLTVSFGDESFLDGVTITHEEFYEKLKTCEHFPITSQPSPTAFQTEYEKILADGDTAVVITISSKLSGSYQSALIAAKGYEDKIFVVDSYTASVGEGVLCMYALDLAEQGKTAAEIAAIIEKEKKHVNMLAILNTMDYLLKGGRISKTKAVVGKVLSIKVVVGILEGKVEMLNKARGSKHASQFSNAFIEKSGGVNFAMPFLLGYAGVDPENLQKYLEQSQDTWKMPIAEFDYAPMGSVIGSHAGPGAYVIGFFSKH